MIKIAIILLTLDLLSLVWDIIAQHKDPTSVEACFSRACLITFTLVFQLFAFFIVLASID